MKHDRSLFAILGSNALTVGVASWQEWPLVLTLWPYWCQSLVIGWYARRRILALRTFTTTGFTIDGRPVEANAQTQHRAANFFLLHYGFFHLLYAVFLLIMAGMKSTGPQSFTLDYGQYRALDWLMVLWLALGFWWSHRASYREHAEADLRREPNIATLIALPYARVVPMHVIVLVGAVIGNTASVLLFGVLKTAADALMHTVEHRWLQAAARAPVPARK